MAGSTRDCCTNQLAGRALPLPDGTRFAHVGAATFDCSCSDLFAIGFLVLTVTVPTRQMSDSYFNTSFP